MNAEDRKKRILVVEDEPILGVLCKRVLAARNFAVDVVDNGLLAKEAVEREDYDLCITDIRLPGISGIQLHEYLQRHSRLADRLIFVTGDTLNGNIQDYLDSCGRPCLMKPFTPEELVQIVHRTLSD